MLAVDVGAELVDALSFSVRDVLGDPLGADPRLRALGGGAGGGLEEGDAPAAAGRLAEVAGPRDRPRRGLVVVLLRGGRARALALPPRRRLHGGDRLRDRLDQPRLRARDRDRAAARLGVRRRRVRRRAADDHPRRRRLPALPAAASSSTRRASRRTRGSSARWRGTPRWTCRPAARGRGGSASTRRVASPRPPTTSSWTGRRSGATSASACSSPARWPRGCPTRGGSRSSWSTTRPRRSSGGPSIGPLVAVISFVCSVGNVPLAAVLWNGGISFGGVIAFIFGDLIIAPILNIYRKYYGWQMAAFLAVVLYGTMVAGRPRRRVPLRGARHRRRPNATRR